MNLYLKLEIKWNELIKRIQFVRYWTFDTQRKRSLVVYWFRLFDFQRHLSVRRIDKRDGHGQHLRLLAATVTYQRPTNDTRPGSSSTCPHKTQFSPHYVLAFFLLIWLAQHRRAGGGASFLSVSLSDATPFFPTDANDFLINCRQPLQR